MSTQPDASSPVDALDGVVADYLQRAEAGSPPDRDAVVAAHPDLADRLRAFFADLDRMGARGAAFRLPDLSLPADFDDYEFLGEVGRGGMGVVYRARQKSLGRVVALKMILSGPLAGQEAMRRFREEAETLSRLDHANVVPIYEAGEHRGLPYFTMKLVEGEPLTRHLHRYAADPKAAATLLVKVCDAVRHAHARGVLHRDLKPGNVLVDSAGEPHVTDFGLARRFEEARALTTTGAVLGTPEYMAPEQAAGARDVTTAVDVYGLGAVLYALLTGQPPFRADSAYVTLRRVVEELPIPPRTARPAAPRDLETVCLKCLEKDPARRYPSAADLGADLGRWLKGEPIVARSVGPLERLRKWARRRPTAAALLLVSLASAALVLGGGSALAWQLATANGQLTAANRDLGVTAGELQAALGDLGASNAELTAEKARVGDALWLREREVYNLQLARVAAVIDRDPLAALLLLYDERSCPVPARDAAWRYYHNAARSHCAPVESGAVVSGKPAFGYKVSTYPAFALRQPHAGRLWALVRDGGHSVTALEETASKEAVVKLPLKVVDLLSGEVRATLPESVSRRVLATDETAISLAGDTIVWIEHPQAAEKPRLRGYDIAEKKWLDPKVELVGGNSYDGSFRRPAYVVLAPDGRTAVLHDHPGDGPKTNAAVIDLRTGEPLAVVPADRGRGREPPVYSPDGTQLAFQGYDEKEKRSVIHLFDLATRSWRAPFEGDGSLEFTPDGGHLLAVNVRLRDHFDRDGIYHVHVYQLGDQPKLRTTIATGVEATQTPHLDHWGKFRGSALRFSPDGRHAAIGACSNPDDVVNGSDVQTLLLVDTRTWEVRHTLRGASHNFAFRRDGTQVVASLPGGLGTLRVWDVETGASREVRQGEHGWLVGLSERDELRSLPLGELDLFGRRPPRHVGTPLLTWNLTRPIEGQVAIEVPEHRRDDRPPALRDPHGDEWTLRVEDRVKYLVNARTGARRQLPIPQGDRNGYQEWDPVVVAAVTPPPAPHSDVPEFLGGPHGGYLGVSRDGQTLVFGTTAGTVELRDFWTGSVRAKLSGHPTQVRAAVWDPDDRGLTTQSLDGTTLHWDMRPPRLEVWGATAFAFTPNGKGLVTATPDGLVVTDVEAGGTRRTALTATPPSGGLEVTPDGKYVVSGTAVLDASTGERVASFGNGDWAMAPDGSHLILLERLRPEDGGDKRELVLSRIELPSGRTRVLDRSPLPADAVSAYFRLLFGADAGEVALVSGYKPWRWIDTATGRTVRTSTIKEAHYLFRHFESGPVLRPDGRQALLQCSTLLTAETPKSAAKYFPFFAVWDFVAEKEKWRLPGRKDAYTAAAYSPDGRWLAVADRAGRVLVLDAEGGTVAAEYDAWSLWFGITSDPPLVTGLRFDPTGRRIALRSVRVAPGWGNHRTSSQVSVCEFSPPPAEGRK